MITDNSVCPATNNLPVSFTIIYTDTLHFRSTNVSKLADPAISTTNFGRQMLAGFSDHYLSDFVLHGTSDEDVHRKVRHYTVISMTTKH